MDIAVFGLGYVGCVSAACLAEIGHKVIGIDRDEHKVRSIAEHKAPFYEPGLEELVAAHTSSGRLTATTDTAKALRAADVAFVCVGTPSQRNGNIGLEQLRRVIADIAAAAEGRTKPMVVAVRSTVFPGTCEEVVIPLLAGVPAARVVSNPEFLREGIAVKDFMEPSLLVIGGSDTAAVRTVADLYTSLPVQPCLVSLRTAEMIKYACNAFHAVKIAFANEVGALSDVLGVDAHEVMDTLCRDVKLNASAAYLRPGFAFGGSCLPKDLRALVYRARRLDLELPLLESALPSNEAHLRRGIDAALDLPYQRVGVVGLAFKENTDDLRESPVVSLLEYLIGKGREVRVYDPQIRLENLYGTNRNFILDAIPHISRVMQPTLAGVLDWAECVVVAQKPSADAASAIAASGLPVLDVVKCGEFGGVAARWTAAAPVSA
ncbi:MAG TPA: nucleotide sugar dehydrogenase [Bryobacteraceae bacterium]|nr:nucleotide sugar dehydrogenase [Bryobacteraceae bacterium]